MSDFDEAGRALLALADDAHDPTDADRTRVRAALAARLGAAAGLGIGTVTAVTATAKAATSVGVTGSAGAAAAGSAAAAGGVTAAGGATVAGGVLAAKLIGLAVVITTTVGVGAGVTVKLTRRTAHDPGPARTSEIDRHRTSGAAPRELPPPVSEQAAPEELWSEPPTSALAAPRPAAERAVRRAAPDAIGAGPRRRSATVSAAHDGAGAPPPSGTDLGQRRPESAVAEEARLVHEGVRALRAGQAASALSLFDTHARLYPDGVLAEERDAERALALADLGKSAEARAAAASFLRKHPASPLGVRLRQRIPGIDAAGTETPIRAPLP